MPTFTTRRGILHYRELGQGLPLVLLHANPGDSRDFEAVILALAERYRVIAPDWPGFGQSSLFARAESLTVLDFYETLQELITLLQLPPALFIGNSVGGNAAARLAAEQPDKVRGLVLVAPSGFTPHSFVTRSFCKLQGSRFALSPYRFASLYLKVRTATSEAMLSRTAIEQATPQRLAISRALWRSFGRPENDLRELAARIKAPTLLLFGRKDIAIPPNKDGKMAQQCIPHARFVSLPCGHASFAEVPGLFLDEVLPFLADCGASD
jgi:pimeloyl-ACP methyl ester carboxylesterase